MPERRRLLTDRQQEANTQTALEQVQLDQLNPLFRGLLTGFGSDLAGAALREDFTPQTIRSCAVPLARVFGLDGWRPVYSAFFDHRVSTEGMSGRWGLIDPQYIPAVKFNKRPQLFQSPDT